MIAIPNKENDMGVYIRDMEKPKGCWDCFNWGCDHWAEYEIIVTDFHDNELEAKVTDLDLVRCGECEYADEYNHCKYSAWWNGNADFCSHGIRRKESR